eukprot:11161834-Lingulodinium_polyedra.AAC.1
MLHSVRLVIPRVPGKSAAGPGVGGRSIVACARAGARRQCVYHPGGHRRSIGRGGLIEDARRDHETPIM